MTSKPKTETKQANPKKNKPKRKTQKKSRSVDSVASAPVVATDKPITTTTVAPTNVQPKEEAEILAATKVEQPVEESAELRATSKKTASAKITQKTKHTATKEPKPKQEDGEKKTRARGSMYGLASLKRTGNVKVTTENGENTVKSNFILGPLVMKVSKSFSRGVKRELRSATATTTEMRGRITLRIVDGVATLRSIKVQQPKQVR